MGRVENAAFKVFVEAPALAVAALADWGRPKASETPLNTAAPVDTQPPGETDPINADEPPIDTRP